MAHKQLVRNVMLVLVVAALSALISYRVALRRVPSRSAGPPAQAENGGCLDFHDAGSHIGEEACVSGRVLRVFVSRASNTFLDFCADYRECPFTTVIFSSDRNRFGDLQTLKGRQVEIRGPVTLYNGRAEIVVHDPNQIRATD